MARKYDLISELYDRTSKTVVSTPENWEAFLRSACYNFRPRFDEQLLVYAERPEATAVLEIERWNESFGRWVNKGAHGIAVFADENRSTQRLKHYFDISDTHESRYSRPVPIWAMREEYTEDVIETLESTFGELSDKSTLETAIMSAALNAAEDNLPDYVGDLLCSVDHSLLDGVSEEEITHIYKQAVANSVAFMMMSRLGIDAASNFDVDDFRGVVNFTTPDTLNALGFATSDIAEMGLVEISRTIHSLDKSRATRNRIIVGNQNPDYNVVENKTERSNENERTDLHYAGGLQSAESEPARTAGGNAGTLRTDAPEVPEGEPQGSVLQSPDEVQADRTSGGNRAESNGDGRNAPEADGSEGRSDGEPESVGYDGLGSEDEQSEEPSAGNRQSGSNIRLEYYDRSNEDKSLPFFGHDDTIREILGTTPHLKASKSEIRAFYETHPDNGERTEYIKSIFNNDYTEVLIGENHDRRVGYKTMQNVLHLWDGSYLSRTAQSFYDWGVIAQHFEAMRLLGELQDTMKPLPSIDGQMSLIDTLAEEKTSAFSFSQEIIDAVLTRGSNVSEGKMRIYEQFSKSLSAKENADFLKEEYGWGGSYPIITGAGIDENHDGKGITISKGFGSDKPHINLTWMQIQKRIGELISLDRYLNPKEKEQYPQWLEKGEQRRAEMAERDANREILRKAPTEKEAEKPTRYEYHLGDTVYIGDDKYEILNLGDDTVTLYDTQYPLFNKEFSRDEFEQKVQENPMNDHLKVVDESGKEKEKEEPELRFNTSEFEKLIPHKMRFKSTDVVNGNELYWVTQGVFTVEDLRDFQQAVTNYDGNIKKFYVTCRDLSPSYTFDDDRAAKVLAVVTPDAILKDDYVNAINEVGLGEYLEPERSEKAYEDAFFINRENESVTWMYYNPDSTAGGQYVTNTVTFDEIRDVLENADPENFFDELGSIANQTLADVGSPWFEEAEAQFNSTPDLTDCTEETRTALFELINEPARSPWQEYSAIKERNPDCVVLYQMGDFFEVMGDDVSAVANDLDLVATQRTAIGNERVDIAGIPSNRLDESTEKLRSLGYDVLVAPFEMGRRNEFIFPSTKEPEQAVETNIGNVPIEDYRDIQAVQNGFDSYEDMYNQSVRLGNGYDKEPEPVKPAWENKPKRKTQSFDIHPEIPMADRHTFDLASNEVETVGKKERFRRNIMAIQLLKKCQDENRFATPDEQVILSKYVGWGGIPEAFDENNSAWATEYLELTTVLTPDEYNRARESTLTAFYTPPEVVSAIYKAMEQMGYREGNILEPSCGIGNFIGMLPKEMQDSKFYGVELDPISAGIAQQLYQKTSIAAQGFEEANLPDSFFDAVVGNVPFGDFGVADKRYDKNHFLIHDYFFAKSLDKLRPGGVMALVTSKGTMDKENSNVRRYIAQRADLLGAIRLPNNTFKGNAGTEVVSDILILQKRDRIVDIEPEWVQLDTDGFPPLGEMSSPDDKRGAAPAKGNGIKMNRYFVEHPEMILGEMKMVSGRFGPEATCLPYENADLGSQLAEAIANIHGEIAEYEVEDELVEEDKSIPADPTVRNFSYTLVDGTIYFRENSRMTPVEVSATAESRIKGLIGIRDCVRNLIELQTEDFPDEEIKAEQSKLNSLYDSFSKKYGLINSRANNSAFSQDSSYSLLSALEVIGDDGELERKADMFFKRTIKPHTPVTSVDTASEALAVSMGEKAQIDMDYMCELTGKTEEEIFSDLKGVIFLNPLYEYGSSNFQKYLMADEYLSGNVREKLAIAKRSAQIYPDDYTINVEALEKVQPKDLTASEIAVRLGATWLPPEDVQDFIFEFLDTPRYAQWNIKVHFSQFTSEWNIEGKAYDRSNVKAYSTYGTGRINAYKIIEETLNLKDVRIFDYVEDENGKKKAILNKKETAIAQAKQELIKQGFQDWIWQDPTRRERLCKLHNERFNSIRPREYDGSHISFSGMNPEIDLREHQRNAVAHILYGGNTLLAHAVGAGKTFEMTAAAMESKRLGLCNKSLFVVPNHLTEQWASEFLQLYPAAKILVATKKDFETKNRKRFCARIATGDYDAVIIGHSQFEKIPMSIERQRAILEQQLEEITNGIIDLKRNRGENFSVKQLEKSKKAIKLKLDKLNDQSRKDDVVTFEELGCDRLFIDESHYYKNLFLYTKMRNVGGIAQTEAQKSSDLFMKCRYLDELTGGRGTVFATGTPISNSMVELYTIQRYLQYNTLVRNDLQHFDSWASTFGETVTAVELTPEGTGYRAKTRFAKFYNLPELMAMFKEVSDIKTADMLDLPVPEAHYHNVAVKPTEMQKEMVASLAERAEKVRGGGVDSSVDNMLKITNDGRKLALDQRMMNDMLPDEDGSKINACVENIFRIWTDTTPKKSAQLVFCDLSTPHNDGSFSVYTDIRKKLIERGVPESEIQFIHDADTEQKKLDLYKRTRRGEVRVLLGSTAKLGAGTNVQNKLVALHDVDCPWRPSDLEQRSGRIIRQGNENPTVDIFRYVTEQTFDAYLYQLIEGKQKFASQIMTSKSPVRSAEDIDETALSYAEIKMLATGNPYIKEKMDLDIQVQKLRLLKSNFLSEKYGLEDKIIKFYPKEIARLTERIENLKLDVIRLEQHPKPTDDRFVGMVVMGVSYAEKQKAGQAIIEACKSMTSPEPIPLGEYRDFKLELAFNTTERTYEVKIKGDTTQSVALGDDVFGNITRIDNRIERLPELLETAKAELDNTERQFETAKKEVEKSFPQEADLKTKMARLDELNILLNMDKRDNELVDGEPDEGDNAPAKKERAMAR